MTMQGKSALLFSVSVITLAFGLFIVLTWPHQQALAGSPTEQPAPAPAPNRLAAPPLPPNPSQADRGAQVYYQVCMACHGDRGQGLTDEWRSAWGEDSNCWASECHGPNHPPWGFKINRDCCKAVIGPDTLTKFKNAQELFDYISKYMPWWKPGYLKVEEFWQVTAFLMRAHNALPNQVTLDSVNASVFMLRPASPLPGDSRPQVLFLVALLVIAAGLFAARNVFH